MPRPGRAAIALVLLLTVVNGTSSAVHFAFWDATPPERALIGVFAVVGAIELAAHLAVLGGLMFRRGWASIAALVLAGVNILLIGPPVVAALAAGGGPGSPVAGQYTNELALGVVMGLRALGVALSVALIVVVARALRRARA